MSFRKIADLPLHSGAAPAWLFRRMVDMAGAIGVLIVQDAGPLELLRRLSDPFWFQAFGCVLGFDWHSSGVTTTVCGAIKEAVRIYGKDLGIVACGGKGASSRKTPDDIRRACDRSGDHADELIYASKMAAKVDNAAVQDGFQLYHHAFFFIPGQKSWCVVQQGMNSASRYARRYHWLSETMDSFVADPHAAVVCDRRGLTLNLAAGESVHHRRALTDISREHPDRVLRDIQHLFHLEPFPLFDNLGGAVPMKVSKIQDHQSDYHLPRRHTLSERDLNPGALKKVLVQTYERQAGHFEQLLGEPGMGPSALRSLSLLAELIYQAPASRRDPAAYSFAHGGKDGFPFPVNRALYDANLDRLRQVIQKAKLGQSDKKSALQSLAQFAASLK